MLSKLQKIAKDLIIYSALVSEYERLDFKDDALAGVRANYFNANCAAQNEKTELTISGKPHSLSCSMRLGAPLSWKISCDNLPVQTVRRASDGSYSVMSYGANGVIFKRQYFDLNHLWLRTEYYDRVLENRISAVISPKRVEGLVVLRLQKYLATGVSIRDLYPSLLPPKKRCAALIYSNSGMIWYDARFKPEQTKPQAEEMPQNGFRFTKEAFVSERVSDVLGLRQADYLSSSDVPRRAEEPVPEQTEPETYSAYDRIEHILFEAHKTNKNIFGELASLSTDQSAPEEKPAEEKSADMPAPEVPEAPEAPEKALEKAPEEVPEEAAENAAVPEVTEEPEVVQVTEEAVPDTVIATKNGVYSYYGAMDENHLRTGRGRTATPDGMTAYDGGYLADKRHGFGVCYYKEGSPNYVGDWKEGNRDGRGVGYRLSDGTMHVGKWSENKPEGFGARFDKEGNFLDVCTYVDGKRNGKSVSFDEDGNIVVRLWRDGEKISEKLLL